MKTAISIPDPTFKRAERAAKRLGISRSEFFTRAVERMLTTLDDEAIIASYNEAYAEPETREDVRFRREVARRGLRAVEWDEG